MNFPPFLLCRPLRGVSLGLAVSLGFAVVPPLAGTGCSTSEPTLQQGQPSMPAGPVAPGPPGGQPPAPQSSDDVSLPGPEPASTPPENDGPGATETNFLTPPCREDGDCGDGRRCVGGARSTAEPDADAGATSDGADAGLAGDAGVVLGRCEAADGG